MTLTIKIPLINPNEPEALAAVVHVQEGQYVTKGEPLLTLETTKSTNEVAAEADGYITGLEVSQGHLVRAGDLFAYIAESQDWTPPISDQNPVSKTSKLTWGTQGIRITQPARDLAEESGVELERLPKDQLITLSMVREYIKQEKSLKLDKEAGLEFNPKAVIVYGGGGHGKTIIDMLRTLGLYSIEGIIDDGLEVGQSIMGVPVLGGAESLYSVYSKGVQQAINAVGGIGNISIRIEIFKRLAAAGFTFPALVHPSAVVETSSVLEAGTQVFSKAYLGSEAQVGFGCIVNTGAIISHDCVLGPYSNISPGAILAGEVSVGQGALIGMGATINLQVRVGAGARIGNGATVKADVPEMAIVRAGTIWP
jgi:acetyltransferase EpsM